jgi:CelD/BcsL family acetyltransferase involved in cellulose biosynthesis
VSSATNYHSPLFGFLTSNKRVTEHLVGTLFAQQAQRIDLSYLPATDHSVAVTGAAARAARYRVLTETRQIVPCVDTRGSWEDYESRLRRKFRSELRRRQRRLEEQGELNLDVHDGTDRLSQLLDEGFRLEGSGWKEAQGSSIISHPSTHGFYTQVARWAAARGWLRLAFLRLNGQALAFDFCLEYNGTHYLLRTGYDPAYSKFGPGMIIRYLMLSRAFSTDISTYDFIGRFLSWKKEWTSGHQPEQVSLHMFAPTVLGGLNRAGFVHGLPAARRVKVGTYSIFGERGGRLVERVSETVRRQRW